MPNPPSEPARLDPARQRELTEAARELLQRRMEGLRLYEPMPAQDAFHKCVAKERLIRGSNRAGKSLALFVEIARATTNQDPYHKYPKTGVCYIYGKDERHLADPVYKKLFRAYAFKMIKDARTGLWRAYRPWEPEDLARSREAKYAPPLIPHRFVKEVGWKDKKVQVPTVIRLHTGWEIHFYSANAEPQKGTEADLIAFDEEIPNEQAYPECAARLIDRNGLFIWGATPEVATDHMFELHERCEKQREDPEPKAVEFFLSMEDNPHVPAEAKRDFEEKLAHDPDRFAAKVKGEFLVSRSKVFPEFARKVHVQPNEQIPPDWTRYVGIDPGYQVCAVAFVAVPPPPDDTVWLYDELYIKGCNSERFGEAMAEKAKYQTFYAFVIDMKMAQQTQVALGKSIAQQYYEALQSRDVRSLVTGSGFAWGDPHPKARNGLIRGWLLPRGDRPPRLKVSDQCQNAVYEFLRYANKVDRYDNVTDESDERKNNHLMSALGFVASYNPVYHTPQKPKSPESRIEKMLRLRQEKIDRLQKRAGDDMVRFGPDPIPA